MRIEIILLLLIFIPLASAQNFTLFQIQDTQFWASKAPDNFTLSMKWLANTSQTMNTKFAVFVGDLEWDDAMSNANQSIRHLEGKVPFLVGWGNHDLPHMVQRYFPDYIHNYSLLEFNETKIGIIGLPYIPNQTELDWADSIINNSNHSNYTWIVATHRYGIHPSQDVHDGIKDGIDLRDGVQNLHEFILNHSNIFMVMSGHNDYYPVTNHIRPDNSSFYSLMTAQIGATYYELWQPLRYYTFVPEEQTIYGTTYSPLMNETYQEFTLSWNMSAPNITWIKGKDAFVGWPDPDIKDDSPTYSGGSGGGSRGKNRNTSSNYLNSSLKINHSLVLENISNKINNITVQEDIISPINDSYNATVHILLDPISINSDDFKLGLSSSRSSWIGFILLLALVIIFGVYMGLKNNKNNARPSV